MLQLCSMFASTLGSTMAYAPTVETRVRHRLADAGVVLPSPSFPRRLSVTEPFIGMAGMHEVMAEWGVAYDPVNVYELQNNLRELMSVKFGTAVADTFELGSPSGDMLHVALQMLLASDGLVAGPPCQPWTPKGTKRGRDDARVDAFDRLLLWIQHLYFRGLLFVILENVKEIFVPDASGYNYGDRVMVWLRFHCPAFRWKVLKIRCCPYLLPHRRVRIFILGLRRDILRSEQHFPLPLDLSEVPPIALSDLLESDVDNVEPSSLHPNRLKRLAGYERYLRERKGTNASNKLVAVFDIDRDLDNAWSAMVTFDIVPTLTCSNNSFFVMSVPDLEQEREDRMYFRFPTPCRAFHVGWSQPCPRMSCECQ